MKLVGKQVIMKICTKVADEDFNYKTIAAGSTWKNLQLNVKNTLNKKPNMIGFEK